MGFWKVRFWVEYNGFFSNIAYMEDAGLPGISIVIPTLNSAETLGYCLDSITAQEYPAHKIEVIIADAGSRDNTVPLAEGKLANLTYTIVLNRLKTGEAGKAEGIKHAKKDIIALIDSDNILPGKNWLKDMAGPFREKDITASEPMYYTYRRKDSGVSRCCAMLGMNDPVCLFLGNYDRVCLLTGRWTEMPVNTKDRGGYLKIRFLDPADVPTIGANGFLIRKRVFEKYPAGDYLFDIDIICSILQNESFTMAKVKTGIVHLYCRNTTDFIRKQRRRVKDYLFYSSLNMRSYPWKRKKRLRICRFVLYTVSILPLFVQSAAGYLKKRDTAWFYYPLLCISTLAVYGYTFLSSLFTKAEPARRG